MIVTARNPRWEIEINTQRNLIIGSEELGKEILEFTVSHQMGNPASTFQIVLRPSPAPARLGPNLEWADVIHPQDFVSISAWVPPREAKFPLIRGFVDTVGTVFDYSSGKPKRHVVIAGRDYGKLLLNARLYYPHEKVQSVAVLEKWRATFDELVGYGDDTPPDVYPPSPEGKTESLFATPGEFMRRVYDGFYRPYEEAVRGTFPASSSIPESAFRAFLDDWEPDLTLINPVFVMENWIPYADLWTMFRAYQHHPWRELFFREEAKQPVLVYRPTPWLNAFGDRVQAWDPETVLVHELPDPAVDIKAGGIVSGSRLRSDEEVRNFFITSPALTADLAQAVEQFGASLLERVWSQPTFQSNPFLIGFDEGDRFQVSAYQRFGFRMHKIISPYLTLVDRGWKEQDVKDGVELTRKWCLEGNTRLVAALGHAETLESGYYVIAGDERIRHGDYLRDRGSYAYLSGVSHHFKIGTAPQDGFFQTRLNYTRSRRLIDHLTREG